MCAKLGEERLGSHQFSKPSAFDPEDTPARKRADEHVKRAFPTDEGTVWDSVLNVLLLDAEIQNQEIAKLIDERFVESASQYQLDLLGEYFGIDRRAGERDEHFRARIKAQLPRQTTMTTIGEIIRVTSQLINSPNQRVGVVENFPPHYLEEDFTDSELDQLAQDYAASTDTIDETTVDGWSDLTEQQQEDALIWKAQQDRETVSSEPARFDVFIEEIAFHNTDLSTDELTATLQEIKAAGVRCVATLAVQFSHRTVDDYDSSTNDPDKAYDQINTDVRVSNTDSPDTVDEQAVVDGASMTDDIGGPYADEITQQYPYDD